MCMRHANMCMPHANMWMPHSNMCMWHSNMCMPHANMSMPHSNMCMPHSNMCMPHSKLTESSPANCSTSRDENTPSLSLSNTWKICNQTQDIETFPGLVFMYLFLFTQGTVRFVLYVSVSLQMFRSRVSMRTWVTFMPNGLPNHTPCVRLGGYSGSFSNEDGDGGNEGLQKKHLYFTFKRRSCLNLFSRSVGLKTCSG